MFISGAKGGGGGSFKSTPDNLRSSDTLEALIGVCAGPVIGPSRGLKSITIDGTPLEGEDGTSNFKDFTAFVADGDPAKHPQIAKMQLGGGSSPINVGLSLASNSTVGTPGPWIVKTVPNVGADALDLRFIVSQLFRQDAKGIYEDSARLDIQLKPTGATTWINPVLNNPTQTYNPNGMSVDMGYGIYKAYIPSENFDGSGNWVSPEQPNFVINGKTTSPYVWELRISVPSVDAYEAVGWDVRVRLLDVESYELDENTTKRTLSWESVAAVYTDPIGGTEAWRGLAWLYLLGRASDQLTSVPEVNGPWKTKIVSVPPSGVFDPEARTYTGAVWDGTYSKAFTRDPAWIVNDAISDPLFGVSHLAPGSFLNKWDALEASKWFSQAVPGEGGIPEPRSSLNFVVDQAQKADELIQYIAGAVGAIAWDTGNGEWRMKVDKPERPVDIFTLENIEGDFHYTHTDIDSRFNDITMSFLNKEFDYREDRVRVWDQAHIDKYGRKPTTLVAVGCTGRREAYRRAMLRLRTNINEWRNVNFVTNRRGRMIRPLDTILVADGGLGYKLPTGIEIPNPGDFDQSNNRSTGRAIAYDASVKKLTLRDTIRLEIGASYTLSYASPSSSYQPNSSVSDRDKPTVTTSVAVVNNSSQCGDVTEIYLADALPSNIAEYPVIAISASGLPAMPKAYRILSVQPDDDGERVSISAIEIDTGKWTASDNVDPAAIEMQVPNATTPSPTAPSSGDILTPTLIPTETVVDKRLLTINFSRPASMFISGFRIGYTLNGGQMIILADNLQDTTFEMQDPIDGSYVFSIWSIDRRGQLSNPLVASIDLDELDFRGGGSISPSGNRVYFSRFEAGAKGWEIHTNPSALAAAFTPLTVTGYEALSLSFTATAAAQTISFGTDNGYLFPVTGSERLAVQAYLANNGPVAEGTLSVGWYDAVGSVISTSVVGSHVGVITLLQNFVEAPPTAVLAELRYEGTTSGTGTGQLVIARPMVSQASGTQTEFPTFTQGPNADNGATRNSFIGDWQSGDDYHEGDIVSFNGSSYGALIAHTAASGNSPPNATYWFRFSASSYGAMLTNESHTVAANSAGVVSSFATAGGDFRVFLGGDEITTGITFSVATAIGVSISIASTGIYTITGMSADQGTATLRAIHAGVTIDKVYSISKSRAGVEGDSGLTFLLTNEVHVVPTAVDGSAGDYSTANGFLQVLDLSGSLTSGAVIGTPIFTNCTGSVNTATNSPISGQPKGYYRVTNMTADSASMQIPVTYGSTATTLTFSLSKSKTGTTGADAKTQTLQCNRQTINFDADGAANPSSQTISFTVNRQNSSATITWSITTTDNSVVSPVSSYLTVAGDGLSATMNVTQFNSARGTAQGVIVRTSMSDPSPIIDQISIVRVAAGSNAKSLMVISDRQGVAYDQNGTPNPTTQTVSLIAVKQNTTATVTWTVADLNGVARTPTTTYLSASTGDAVSMTQVQFAAARNGTAGVLITGTLTDGTTFTDKVSVLRVADGAAGVGFSQDSPTPSAVFVNQTWYKPTAKEWYRASAVGTAGWVRILGNLSSLDIVATSNINPNAITQTVQVSEVSTVTWSGSSYPALQKVMFGDITTLGGAVHVNVEAFTELYANLADVPTSNAIVGSFALTRGPTTLTITGGMSLSTYLTNSGTAQLLAPANVLNYTNNGGATASLVFSPKSRVPIAQIDAPAAGAYRYALWFRGENSTTFVTAASRNLKLLEVKR